MTVDAPPTPQTTIAEAQFIAVEKDDYAWAHARAREQLARRYPASAEYLEAEQSLIKQYLAARK